MLIITAPAKTLDLLSPYPKVTPTQPLFLTQAEHIVKVLKRQSVKDLKKIMLISDKLAEENYVRIQRWKKEHNPENSRPAIFTYAGDIFVEMFPRDWTADQEMYAQRSVRIISGVYGMIRPYDLMQPYRLEMKSKLPINRNKNLYEFWKPTLTDELNEEINTIGHEYFLNLASDESSDAINLDKLACKIIKVEFREKEGRELKNVPIYSKHARGMMIEYCVKNHVEKPEDLKGFSTNGYTLESYQESMLIFAR